ncbi:MAG: MobA/MobL family protein, partial [Oscillospiraceae bacterium]|nr:MobA/MobL family protein [Oscillospiraceae bacterium]
REIPPQPTLHIDMAEFRAMQNLMAQLRRRARVAKEIQEIEIPRLKSQLAETKGLFKGKERKAIEAQIAEAERQARALKDEIFDLVRQEGYPDGQAFLSAYNKADSIVRQYNRDLAEWERRADRQAEKPRRRSVLEELRRLEAEGKQQTRRARTAQHRVDAR